MDWLLLIILAAALAWSVWTYNRFVRLRNQVNEAWAGIDVQLQRRYDLVPGLVATVKGYTKHESGVLERVTRHPCPIRHAGGETGLFRQTVEIELLHVGSESVPEAGGKQTEQQSVEAAGPPTGGSHGSTGPMISAAPISNACIRRASARATSRPSFVTRK